MSDKAGVDKKRSKNRDYTMQMEDQSKEAQQKTGKVAAGKQAANPSSTSSPPTTTATSLLDQQHQQQSPPAEKPSLITQFKRLIRPTTKPSRVYGAEGGTHATSAATSTAATTTGGTASGAASDVLANFSPVARPTQPFTPPKSASPTSAASAPSQTNVLDTSPGAGAVEGEKAMDEAPTAPQPHIAPWTLREARASKYPRPLSMHDIPRDSDALTMMDDTDSRVRPEHAGLASWRTDTSPYGPPSPYDTQQGRTHGFMRSGDEGDNWARRGGGFSGLGAGGGEGARDPSTSLPHEKYYLPPYTESGEQEWARQSWEQQQDKSFREDPQFFDAKPYLPASTRDVHVDFATGEYCLKYGPMLTGRATGGRSEPAEWDSGRYLGQFGADRLKSGEFFRSEELSHRG